MCILLISCEKYSWLSITQTLKGSRKRFDLSRVKLVTKSWWPERKTNLLRDSGRFELSGVNCIFEFLQLTPDNSNLQGKSWKRFELSGVNCIFEFLQLTPDNSNLQGKSWKRFELSGVNCIFEFLQLTPDNSNLQGKSWKRFELSGVNCIFEFLQLTPDNSNLQGKSWKRFELSGVNCIHIVRRMSTLTMITLFKDLEGKPPTGQCEWAKSQHPGTRLLP